MATLDVTSDAALTSMTAPAAADRMLIVDDGTDVLQDISLSVLANFTQTQLRYKITPTVSADDLIVALKHEDGTDPSTDRPLYFKIGDTIRSVTAALSVTVADAANTFNAGAAELATKEIDYFVYIGYNATDGVVIGFSRIPYANLYNDFSATSTNEKYCAISTITNAAAGDDYVNIGRFAATLSAGAGYTWTVPTFTSANLIQRPIYATRLLTFVPTPTGITLGNSTLTGSYYIDEKKLRFVIGFTLGSTGSITGGVTFKLPFTYIGSGGNNNILIFDAGTGVFFAAAYPSGTTTIEVVARSTGGTYEGLTTLSSTVPMTWATGDEIRFSDGEVWLA